ncbi:MAG TPA: ABC transporter ATP-binding protein [Paenirhodobacter sp.]
MSHLVLQALCKKYHQFVAVAETSLQIKEAEFISLLGPSGCGKTTTLQMIAGFTEPTSGRVLLNGADLTPLDPNRRGLGMVFQSYALFPHMTVADNVSFGLEMRKVSAPERTKRVADALELVGLSDFRHRYPVQMSGGQQQRVALARALVIRPPVLLLDEPLSNLDAKLREDMQEELLRIQRSLGTTTVMVTHDQSEAMAMSDRIVVMDHGRVEQVGAPEDVYAAPASDFVARFLGRMNMLDATISLSSGAALLNIAGYTLAAPDTMTEGPVRVSIRPEMLFLADEGVPGTIGRRAFHGAFWVCEVITAAGPVSFIHPNTGRPAPHTGAAVRLGIRPAGMTLVPAAAVII